MSHPAPDPVPRICLVVNPRAGGGRAGARLDDLRRRVEGIFPEWEVVCSEGPGHAATLARAAADAGFDLVAAVGGDGTCNEVVNGLAPLGEAGPAFTVIPFGTGSDLIRSLGIPADTDQALRLAASGTIRPVDLGLLDLEGHDGARIRRWFVNVVGFGVNGEVVARANRSTKRLGGFLTFLGATLSSVAAWRPVPVVLRWEGPEPGTWEGDLNATFVANGHWCGGGMWVGRHGRMDDGLMELTVLPPLGLLDSAVNMPRLYRGTAEEAPGAFRTAVSTVEVRTRDPEARVRIDMDGEQPGYLPLSLQVRPRALRVRAGWA